jgi:hypothetical protein
LAGADDFVASDGEVTVSGLTGMFEHPHLPPLDGATEWIKSAPLSPAGLRGRVVLVDFWTLTCINWLRTEPYVRAITGRRSISSTPTAASAITISARADTTNPSAPSSDCSASSANRWLLPRPGWRRRRTGTIPDAGDLSG